MNIVLICGIVYIAVICGFSKAMKFVSKNDHPEKYN